jgi:hypothetical protein
VDQQQLHCHRHGLLLWLLLQLPEVLLQVWLLLQLPEVLLQVWLQLQSRHGEEQPSQPTAKSLLQQIETT